VRLMNPRLEFERVRGRMFIFVLIMISCNALHILSISYHIIHCVHYYLDTPAHPSIPPIHHMGYGLKPFSELGEHNDFHLQKRRLSCILSIAIDQLNPNDRRV